MSDQTVGLQEQACNDYFIRRANKLARMPPQEPALRANSSSQNRRVTVKRHIHSLAPRGIQTVPEEKVPIKMMIESCQLARKVRDVNY